MAGAFSNYLETAVANLTLRGTAYTSPGQVFLALFTVDPGETGTAGTECAYSGYARQTCGVTPSSAFSVPDATGMTQNQNVITFPAVAGSTIVVVSWGLYDALTGGNLLFYGSLTSSKSLDPSDVPSFPANALKITFD